MDKDIQRPPEGLRSVDLEGIKVKVPNRSEKLLQEEYGKKALTNDCFHW
jgi:hypothetical protein